MMPTLTSPEVANPVGVKYDGGKPRLDLVSHHFLNGIGAVLGYGAAKYAARNWEKGIEFGRVFAALMRHLWAWWGGEEFDPESGLHHLDHAACCLMFLRHFVAMGYDDLDDRACRVVPERIRQ